jgi:cobalt-zinc-cadmium efflux system protein
VQSRLLSMPGVVSIHDLHIWPMSTTDTALTCHLVVPDGHPGDAFIARTAQMLHEEFEIRHTTIQLEVGINSPCPGAEGCTQPNDMTSAS